MAIAEGTQSLPTDTNGTPQGALYDGGYGVTNGNLWLPRSADAIAYFLASGARTSTFTGTAFNMFNMRGLLAILTITAGTSPLLQVTFLTGNGSVYCAPTPSAAGAIGTYGWVFHPDVQTASLTPVANTASARGQAFFGGPTILQVLHGNGNSITYSVSVYYLP